MKLPQVGIELERERDLGIAEESSRSIEVTSKLAHEHDLLGS
jgi:hypothetical protein